MGGDCPRPTLRLIKDGLAQYNTNMSEFKVNLTAVNPKEEDRRTPPVEALVDTGAHSSWFPRRLLLDAGITPRGKVQFQMANKHIRVVRKLQFLNNFLIKIAKYRTLVRYFARLVRRTKGSKPTGFSHKSILPVVL